jgi:hypothetical protein
VFQALLALTVITLLMFALVGATAKVIFSK